MEDGSKELHVKSPKPEAAVAIEDGIDEIQFPADVRPDINPSPKVGSAAAVAASAAPTPAAPAAPSPSPKALAAAGAKAPIVSPAASA